MLSTRPIFSGCVDTAITIDVAPMALLVVRIGRAAAGVHGVFVKYLLGHRVGWPSEPRVVGSGRSCNRGAARPSLPRDGDDLVGLETNADDNPSADIGTAPPTASTPELHPDPELLVPHPSRRRLTHASAAGAAGRLKAEVGLPQAVTRVPPNT